MEYQKIITDSSSLPSKFADFTDFDQLDPCCQKEIIHERKKQEISTKLREFDRSEKRLDVFNKVIQTVDTFNTYDKLFTCGCCIISADYISLAKFKEMEYCHDVSNDNNLRSYASELEQISEKGHENQDNDDDDGDTVFDGDDDYISDFELQRKQEIQDLFQKLQFYKAIGYGRHVNESLKHLSILTKCLPYVIVHIFEDTYEDAQIDFYFEKLANKYTGTIFRRVALTDFKSAAPSVVTQLLSVDCASYEEGHSINTNSSTITNQPYGNANTFTTIDSMQCKDGININIADIMKSSTSSILCFINSSLYSVVSDLSTYICAGELLRETDLCRYFDMINILSTQPNDTNITKYQLLMKQIQNNGSNSNNNNNENDERDKESYCDDPSCSRKFPHEHIGPQKGFLGMKNITQANAKDSQALEILSPNYFTRL